jgi:hypothetical protein
MLRRGLLGAALVLLIAGLTFSCGPSNVAPAPTTVTAPVTPVTPTPPSDLKITWNEIRLMGLPKAQGPPADRSRRAGKCELRVTVDAQAPVILAGGEGDWLTLVKGTTPVARSQTIHPPADWQRLECTLACEAKDIPLATDRFLILASKAIPPQGDRQFRQSFTVRSKTDNGAMLYLEGTVTLTLGSTARPH